MPVWWRSPACCLATFLGAFSVKKFYFVDTFALLAMLIVGGMATVSGALAGAVLITLVTEFLRRIESGVDVFGYQTPNLFGTTQIGIGLIILLVMYKRAGGLFDRLEWDEIVLPRLSRRRRSVTPNENKPAAVHGAGRHSGGARHHQGL